MILLIDLTFVVTHSVGIEESFCSFSISISDQVAAVHGTEDDRSPFQCLKIIHHSRTSLIGL